MGRYTLTWSGRDTLQEYWQGVKVKRNPAAYSQQRAGNLMWKGDRIKEKHWPQNGGTCQPGGSSPLITWPPLPSALPAPRCHMTNLPLFEHFLHLLGEALCGGSMTICGSRFFQTRVVRLDRELLYPLSHLSRIVPFPGDTKFVSCHAFQFWHHVSR